MVEVEVSGLVVEVEGSRLVVEVEGSGLVVVRGRIRLGVG